MHTLLHAGVFLVGLIYQTFATAGSFQIVPVRITLSTHERTAVLVVRNDSAEASVMQIETVSWSQAKGEDRYAPTREILATPPVFTIPSGGSQIVRVGMRRQPDGQRELAYRVFLREVPTKVRQAGEVQVALRFGIPVFVVPKSQVHTNQVSKPMLEWRAVAVEPGRLSIKAINRGDVHVQITGFALKVTGGLVIAEHDGMKYLLPGQSHDWIMNSTQSLPSGVKLKIVARTDAGEIQTEVLPPEH